MRKNASSRSDLSNYLVHWTSGVDYEEAFQSLLQILLDAEIIGSIENIKGNNPCVCFTETPEREFHKLRSKFKPFGIQISKRWLFAQGGRPVIYQSDDEYPLLPKEMRWRHVRYEPIHKPPIDFTWEREWRINTLSLKLDHNHFVAIVPDEKWATRMIDEFETESVLDERKFDALDYGENYEGLLSDGGFFYYSTLDT